MSAGDIFLGLIAVLFPPVAVWIKSGLCSADSFVNILLCMLGYLPGLIHAWYIIAKNPEYDYEVIPDSENPNSSTGGQRVTYYYVSQDNRRRPGGNNSGYGTQGQGRVAVPPAPAPKPARPTPNAAGSSRRDEGETSSGAPPPSYADAVKGDHKVQSQE